MNRSIAPFALLFVISGYKSAWAFSTFSYNVVQESIFTVIAIACLLLAFGIYSSLKGGSLGVPWLFFVIGFAVAAIGGIMHLMDLFKILISQYDLRLATLLTTCGSMIFLLLGLYFYRRGLE